MKKILKKQQNKSKSTVSVAWTGDVEINEWIKKTHTVFVTIVQNKMKKQHSIRCGNFDSDENK